MERVASIESSHPPQVSGAERRDIVIEEGRCLILFAYDVGLSVDLDHAERLISESTQREQIKHRRRAPRHFEYRPLPLRITQQSEPFGIGKFRSAPAVRIVIYDFGALHVTYELPLHGPLEELVALSDELYDNAKLLSDSRTRVRQLLNTLEPAVTKPFLSDATEDYAIYEIRQVQGNENLPERIAEASPVIAQVLRSERASLSHEEVRDATLCRLSFGKDDVTLVDWNAAFVFDKESDDAISVLEYANVELLEMRLLDQQLDDALTDAYRALSERRPGSRLRRHPHSHPSRIAQMQVDSAMMFEGVNNALKLLGDQYLARLYQLASQRFHLAEWDASIMRKLKTLDSIYTKMSDKASTRRMEVLEWIIIILIAVSILMPFIPGFSSKVP